MCILYSLTLGKLYIVFFNLYNLYLTYLYANLRGNIKPELNKIKVAPCLVGKDTEKPLKFLKVLGVSFENKLEKFIANLVGNQILLKSKRVIGDSFLMYTNFKLKFIVVNSLGKKKQG